MICIHTTYDKYEVTRQHDPIVFKTNKHNECLLLSGENPMIYKCSLCDPTFVKHRKSLLYSIYTTLTNPYRLKAALAVAKLI